MKNQLAILFLASCLLPSANAEGWSFTYAPAAAKYIKFGGDLGDPVAPTQKDTKIAFEVDGAAAKDIFEAIGPDKKDICGATPNTRFRSRDGGRVACVKNARGEYSCYFGFDLQSGKSIGGSIC